MGHKFVEIAFTEQVKKIQIEKNSRAGYERMEQGEDFNYLLSQAEADFIQARDSFYMASVSETGWPYVQHRGGPAGFMKVIDAQTIGFADYSGNRQYVSTGNFRTNDRVSIIFMDYPNKRRLKLLGRVSLVNDTDWNTMAKLEDDHYRANVERAFIIKIEAFDWNCPQHIQPRFTESELEKLVEPLNQQIESLTKQLSTYSSQNAPAQMEIIGEGPLSLVVTGVRQLTKKIRAFEFRDINGGLLPEIKAGAHLVVPFIDQKGELSHRRYSICSNPNRRDIYEIAVLKEENGSGGSKRIHETFNLGTQIRCGYPENYFEINPAHKDVILIAGGIGITPIKSMAQSLQSQGRKLHIHYLGKSKTEMAFSDRLEREFAERISFYESENQVRLSVSELLSSLSEKQSIYLCGPERLIEDVVNQADKIGIAKERIRYEKFSVKPLANSQPFKLNLARSNRMIEVAADESALDAILDAGIALPFSCKTGECKSCQVKVLEGEVEHRDEALSEEERDDQRLMCPCVSRAKSEYRSIDV